jgi:hypothetical protein
MQNILKPIFVNSITNLMHLNIDLFVIIEKGCLKRLMKVSLRLINFRQASLH